MNRVSPHGKPLSGDGGVNNGDDGDRREVAVVVRRGGGGDAMMVVRDKEQMRTVFVDVYTNITCSHVMSRDVDVTRLYIISATL